MSLKVLSSLILILPLLFNFTFQIDYKAESLRLHFNKKGKIETQSKVPLKTIDDLSIIYTPGVIEPAKKISSDNSTVYKYTLKSHTVAVVTDWKAKLFFLKF